MFKYTHPWQALCQTIDPKNKKPPALEIPVSEVTRVESQPSATVSEDPLHRSLLNSDTQPGGIPEVILVQSKDSGQDGASPTDTSQVPTGFSDWLEEQTGNGFVLKEREEKEPVFPKGPQMLTDTQGSLGEMEGTQRNGPSVKVDCSPPSCENGTRLLSHSPVRLIDSESSVSTIPMSEIDCNNDVIIHAQKVSVIQHPVTDKQDVLVNGGAGMMISTQAEGEKGWTPSTTLATIKREANFDLRTYHAEKKPTSLFPDDEEGKYQTVIIKERADDEMLAKERRQIIRNQAMKKNATIAERWGSAEQLDMEEKLSFGDSTRKQDETWTSETETNASSSPNESSITHPEDINTEQINFTAARQQFLAMESSQQDAPMSPKLSAQPYRAWNHSSRLSQSSQSLPYKDSRTLDTSPVVSLKVVTVNELPDREKGATEEPSNIGKNVFIAEKVAAVENGDGESRRNLPVYSSIDDLDSGLGEMCNDYSYGYASDGGASNEMLNIGTDNSGTFESSEQKVMLETPIEKEIRLAMEREESLRKERGIRKLGGSEEMVQIRTKPLLSPLPPTSPFSKSKDKNRMVFFVQREIEMDSKREEKLRQEGKVKGLYDKGIPEEVEKRKMVFEQQVDDVPVVPQLGRQPKVATSASQEPLDVCDLPEERSMIQVNPTECKVILRESPEYQLFSKSSSTPEPATRSTVTKLPESQSTHDEEPYILRPLKSQTTFLIEREIEEEQRREEELRARRLREQPAGSLPSTRASTPDSPNSTFNPVFPGQPSRAVVSDGEQSPSLLGMLQRQERQKSSEKKDDSSVLESTRVTRRKSALAQRWEAGMFYNHLEE
ncbi:A-kinase anchor protein 2-like isoform X2 [Mustelus asterias]